MLTHTELLDQANRLRRQAVVAAPGRTAGLVETRVAQLLRSPTAGQLPDDLTEGEQLVVDLTEQFLIDVLGITDAQFARLGEYWSEADQIAIMFQLAFADGFAKLAKVHPDAIELLSLDAVEPVDPVDPVDPVQETS